MTAGELMSKLKRVPADTIIKLSTDGCMTVDILRMAYPKDKAWTVDDGTIAILGDDCF